MGARGAAGCASGARAGSASVATQAGAVTVRFEPSQRGGDEGTRVAVAVPGPPGFAHVCIRRETDIPWAGEIEVGDKLFDATFVVEGPPRLVRALLDAETRRLLNRLNAASGFVISGGEIRVLISETKLGGFLPRLVEAGERLAKRLAAEIEAVGGWEGLETLFDHVPRDAQRIIITSQATDAVDDLAGRRVKRAIRYPIQDFYLTNPIARASVVMQRCSAELLHGEDLAEAAE